MKDIISFIAIFIIIYLYYMFFIVIKNKKNNLKNMPVEAKFIIYRHHLKLDQEEYNKLLMIISLVSSFDIAFVITFIYHFIRNVYAVLGLCVLMLLPLIFISFDIIGKYFVKNSK